LPQELGVQAFQDSFAFSYLFSTYAWGNFIRPWIQRSINELSAALTSKCSRALALGMLGLISGRKICRSRPLYSTAHLSICWRNSSQM
jgi:hypothetical protein